MTEHICKHCIHWGNEFGYANRCEIRKYYTMEEEDCDKWEERHE